jgi:hypothetical protein
MGVEKIVIEDIRHLLETAVEVRKASLPALTFSVKSRQMLPEFLIT